MDRRDKGDREEKIRTAKVKREERGGRKGE